jgi:hypothetical protein
VSEGVPGRGAAAPGSGPAQLRRLLSAALLVLLVALVAGLVWHQRLEKDEGYLAEGAWLVACGRVPYRDFIFPQQPYFPLVYGALLWLVGPSLVAARALSAVLFLALGGLVFILLRRLRPGAQVPYWGALFFCFNTLSLYWYPRARQYALADVLLFLGFVLVSTPGRSGPDRRGLRACLLGGAAAGASAEVRLLLAPAVVALAIAAGRGVARRWSWRRSGAFAWGVLLANLPFLWLLARQPEAWLKDAYALQLVLRPPLEIGVLFSQVRLSLVEFVSVPENVWLLVAAGLAVLPGRERSTGPARWTLALLLIVAAAALLTYPTQGQYLVEVVPYLAVLAALGMGRLAARLSLSSGRFARLAPAAMMPVLVLLGGGRAAARIVYDHHHDRAVGMASFLAYQDLMQRLAGSDDRMLLTWWPGYLLVRGVTPYPGAELGRPTERALGRLSQAEYAAWGMRHPDAIAADLRAGVPRFVVAGYSAPEGVARLLEASYTLRASFPGIEVYERRAALPRGAAGSP